MKRYLLLLCFIAFISMHTNLFAAEPEEPSREEIINEVARQTGLSNDSVTLIAKESPQLLQGLNETVFGIKIVNSLCDAKDTEALVDLLGYAIDKLKDKVFPTPMNTFLLAFGAYKTALEVIRDYYYVPKFDNKIYDKYREVRMDELRRGDTSAESISNCFEQATTQKDSGYFVLKNKMFDRMLAAKGYNKEQLGKKVEDKLWKEIDNFWMARCEAKLQQERLKQNKAEIEKQIWERVTDRLDAIKKAAGGKTSGGVESFFYTESTIPNGWKLSRSNDSLKEFKPTFEPAAKRTFQRFTMYPAEFTEKLDSSGGLSQLYTADNKRVPEEKKRFIRIYIWISPSVETDQAGNVFVTWKEMLVEQMEKQGGWQPDLKLIKKITGNGINVGYFTREVIRNEPRNSYQCKFVKGSWLVHIGTWGHSKFDDQEITEQIVHYVAGRIPVK